MKLIILYGPPAVGKLTVGQELAKLTGFRLFHNHLAIDLAHEIYEWGNPAFFTLVHQIRTIVVVSAVESETSLILTFFYTGAANEDMFFKLVIELVEKAGGEVDFVHLTAPDEVLLERVTSKSRKQFGKLTTKDSLIETLRVNKRAIIDYRHHKTIDIANLAPSEVAKQIMG
jgi:shikimate kinase